MKSFKQFTGKLNKTETAIMKWIEDNGYFTSERIYAKGYSYGARNCNACKTLLKKGLIKIKSSDSGTHSIGGGYSSDNYSNVWVKA